MKLDVIKLDGGKAGSIELNEALFGLEPRADVLHRVVRWQRAKAQAGTHSTLGKSDVSYSTKKIYKQKGTGGARHSWAPVLEQLDPTIGVLVPDLSGTSTPMEGSRRSRTGVQLWRAPPVP